MTKTIIAVGNGGFNIAKDLINAHIFTDVNLIVCDTNEKDLQKNATNANETFLLERTRSKIKSTDLYLEEDVIAKTTDSVIVCASLGGMTGSKYGPLIALGATLKGKFVCSIISRPYNFEGEQKSRRASEAWFQIIAASKLVIQQDNEELKSVESLVLNDINKPLIDTIKSLVSNKTLEEASNDYDNSGLQLYIPAEFRVKEMALVWIRNDVHRGISDEDRKNLFNGIPIY